MNNLNRATATLTLISHTPCQYIADVMAHSLLLHRNFLLKIFSNTLTTSIIGANSIFDIGTIMAIRITK